MALGRHGIMHGWAFLPQMHTLYIYINHYQNINSLDEGMAATDNVGCVSEGAIHHYPIWIKKKLANA